jgi:hypothetical protein
MIETTQRSESSGQPAPAPVLHYILDSRSRWERTRRVRNVVALLLVIGVCVGAAAYWFLWPNMPICREPTWRIQCAANMKQVSLALQIYASANAGQFPPSFDELLSKTDITSANLKCPISGGPYVYVGAGLFSQTSHPPTSSPTSSRRTTAATA